MSALAPLEVYFDFDGTIAQVDVLDELIARHSIDERWKAVEAEWERGAIGSRECLERQLARVRISSDGLAGFLDGIAVDPAFPALVGFLRERGVAPAILSDSFTPLISRILARHGVEDIRILANDFRLEGDRPVVGFPYAGAICSDAGNCKCSHLYRRDRPAGSRKVYVGDGRSDICPAGHCEILFAKAGLLSHYAGRHPNCIPFDSLRTVHDHLRLLLP